MSMLEKPQPKGEVIFVGGIYGSGKSTLCSKLAARLNATHLKASDLARHQVRGAADEGKAVVDVPGNQEVLLTTLSERTSTGGRFLLDGHFCIYNRELEIEPISVAVFKSMAPAALLLVDIDPNIAIRRLEDREKASFDFARLRDLRSREKEHAETVSRALMIPLEIVQFDISLEELTKTVLTRVRN